MKMPHSALGIPHLVAAAWSLVRHHGLKEKAFDKASASAIHDALWLISRGAGVAEIVRTMNTEHDQGERILRARRATLEHTIRAHGKNTAAAMNAATLAALLSRLDLGAMLAEIMAVARVRYPNSKPPHLMGIVKLFRDFQSKPKA